MIKNVLIVSAASSLGNEIIKKFINNNYFVFATFNKKKISNNHKNIKKIKLDILNPLDHTNFSKNTNSYKFDSIIFLNGIINGKSFYESNLGDSINTFNINCIYPFFFLRNIRKSLSLKTKIIFLSSISSTQGSYDPYYAASKSALNMLVKCLAKDKKFKIKKIISISPSLISSSKMFFDMSKENRNIHKSKNPLNKLVKKKDLADFIFTHGAKNNWDHTNGTNIEFHGGI